MIWTTNYPTKPGFYWIRNYRNIYGESDDNPTVVEMDKDGDFYWPGSDRTGWKYQVASAEWQGPIEPEAELEPSDCMVGGHGPGCRCHEGEPVKRRYDLFPETVCADCLGRCTRFKSWQIGQSDGNPIFGLICEECWIERLTPEQRKVYMV